MQTTSRAALWTRRYGWVAYRLVFVALTLDAARSPGFVPHRETVPYPWAPALLTCALLGAQTAALNAVLGPSSANQSWKRVASASTLALLFAALSVVTMVTDMPGYYYTPGLFALTNMFVVPMVGTMLVRHPLRR
jgi:hypothetical protein